MSSSVSRRLSHTTSSEGTYGEIESAGVAAELQERKDRLAASELSVDSIGSSAAGLDRSHFDEFSDEVVEAAFRQSLGRRKRSGPRAPSPNNTITSEAPPLTQSPSLTALQLRPNLSKVCLHVHSWAHHRMSLPRVHNPSELVSTHTHTLCRS
eukprot:SAG11_NODE_7194_length_1180_cov_1.260870_2_plen_153_part_00